MGVAFQQKARSRFASPGLFCFSSSAKQACVGLKTKKPGCIATELFLLVRMKGLEPSHLTALVPKTSVSTNFTTSASIGTANIDRKITLREKMIGWLEKLTLRKILLHGKF